MQKTIPREDVSTVIMEVLGHPETIGKVMVMSTGETPVKETISSV